MVNAPYGMPRHEEKPPDEKPEAKRPPVNEERPVRPKGNQTGKDEPKLGTSQDIQALKQKAKTFKNSKRISVVYDKFKDETWEPLRDRQRGRLPRSPRRPPRCYKGLVDLDITSDQGTGPVRVGRRLNAKGVHGSRFTTIIDINCKGLRGRTC